MKERHSLILCKKIFWRTLALEKLIKLQNNNTDPESVKARDVQIDTVVRQIIKLVLMARWHETKNPKDSI